MLAIAGGRVASAYSEALADAGIEMLTSLAAFRERLEGLRQVPRNARSGGDVV